jgi:hypothetical protein
MYKQFYSKNLNGRYLRRWDIDSKMKFLNKAECETEDWRHIAQDRDQWRAPVSTVMNLLVP